MVIIDYIGGGMDGIRHVVEKAPYHEWYRPLPKKPNLEFMPDYQIPLVRPQFHVEVYKVKQIAQKHFHYVFTNYAER